MKKYEVKLNPLIKNEHREILNLPTEQGGRVTEGVTFKSGEVIVLDEISIKTIKDKITELDISLESVAKSLGVVYTIAKINLCCGRSRNILRTNLFITRELT